MTVEVTLFATLGRYRPRGAPGHEPTSIELADASTLAGLLAALGIPPDTPYVALVNGDEASAERRLAAGDCITLFPPLAGGS